MRRTKSAGRSGLARLQRQLAAKPRRKRVRETLTVDDGGPVTCQLSLERVSAMASVAPADRVGGSSIRDLADEVDRARVEPFEPLPEPGPAAMPSPPSDVAPGPAPAPATALPEPPSEKDPFDEDTLVQDLATFTSVRHPPAPNLEPVPASPEAAPGSSGDGVTEDRNAVFDRIQKARQSGTYATGSSSDVFDRILRNRDHATTFDVGSFQVQRRFDDFDQMLAAEDVRPVSREPEPPPTESPEPAPSAEPVSEVDVQDDLNQIRGVTPAPVGEVATPDAAEKVEAAPPPPDASSAESDSPAAPAGEVECVEVEKADAETTPAITAEPAEDASTSPAPEGEQEEKR